MTISTDESCSPPGVIRQSLASTGLASTPLSRIGIAPPRRPVPRIDPCWSGNAREPTSALYPWAGTNLLRASRTSNFGKDSPDEQLLADALRWPGPHSGSGAATADDRGRANRSRAIRHGRSLIRSPPAAKQQHSWDCIGWRRRPLTWKHANGWKGGHSRAGCNQHGRPPCGQVHRLVRDSKNLSISCASSLPCWYVMRLPSPSPNASTHVRVACTTALRHGMPVGRDERGAFNNHAQHAKERETRDVSCEERD